MAYKDLTLSCTLRLNILPIEHKLNSVFALTGVFGKAVKHGVQVQIEKAVTLKRSAANHGNTPYKRRVARGTVSHVFHLHQTQIVDLSYFTIMHCRALSYLVVKFHNVG